MSETIADLTPAELRRRIAERLGYTVRNFHHEDEPGDPYWILCDPDGHSMIFQHHGPNWPADPDDHYTGNPSAEAAWNDTPDWPGDLNAAIELLPIQRTVSVGRDADAPLWWCAIKRKSGEVEAREHGPDPAMACARAWLAWREAHVEKGEGNA